tara:strand:+ start:404 stop:616 length:213 start_codon:yes stop_codon:yes gene_type:complete
MTKLYKHIERWFYLQLELMINMYKRRGNPFFTYEETHKPNEIKKIAKFDIKNKDNKIVDSNIRFWNSQGY